MDKQGNTPKNREIMYQVGRKKGKITLGGNGSQLAAKTDVDDATEQLSEEKVTGVQLHKLFNRAPMPSSKMLAGYSIILPVLVAGLTGFMLYMLLK